MKSVCVVLLLYLILYTQQSSSHGVEYSVGDHAYLNLLVSVSPDIPATDSGAVLENIKDWLTLGSRDLYKATKGWAFIQTVKILVPAEWEDVTGDVSTAFHETHEDAEIRVEYDHSVYKNSPFTLQTGGCGEPGEYTQVSSDFFIS